MLLSSTTSLLPLQKTNYYFSFFFLSFSPRCFSFLTGVFFCLFRYFFHVVRNDFHSFTKSFDFGHFRALLQLYFTWICANLYCDRGLAWEQLPIANASKPILIQSMPRKHTENKDYKNGRSYAYDNKC